MARNRNDNSHLWLGLALGGLAIGAAVVLFKTKQGNQIRKDLTDTYDDYKEKLTDFAQDISKTAANEWPKRIQKLVDIFQDNMELLNSPKNQNLKTGLLIGGVLGALVAAGVAIYSHNSNEEEGVVGRVIRQASCLKNKLAAVVDALEEREHEHHNHRHEHNGSHPNSMLDNVLDLATTGIHVWNQIKK